jgi:hypothetical protein
LEPGDHGQAQAQAQEAALIRDGHVLHIDARKDRAMTKRRLDDLLRSFASGLSRRATLSALSSGIFGAGSLALLDDSKAKKKRKRKKKRKKCKGGTKKCGKTCIPASGCCSSADCGNGTCVGNSCDCDSGFKECNGTCIPQGDCCGACPGETICVGGECVCPGNAPFACPGDVCAFGGQCCDTSECPNPQECLEGVCTCPGADAINCIDRCCDGAADEVCKVDLSNPEEVQLQCQPDGCPATNICSDFETERFLCAHDPLAGRACICTLTVDLFPLHVCVDFFSLGDKSCQECDTSSDCGTGRACVADGPGCDCGVNFCVDLCPEATFNRAKRGAGGAPVDLEALKDGMRKRRR